MTKTALVLGGGGMLGVSWSAGMIAGLRDAGVDVTGADRIVGTSAGSIVGTQIAQGESLDEMIEWHHAPRDPDAIELNMEIDIESTMAIFAKWAACTEMTPEDCAEIGAMALASKTVEEDRWIESFKGLIGAHWPDRDVILTAVDAENGAFQTWTRDSGVAIHRAIASSCSVPGLFPPVAINGRRYQDGGVRSTTNADLASGFDTVLIVAPIGARPDGIDPLPNRLSTAEAETLRAAGASVELAFPDEGSQEAMGINRMDSSRRGLCVDAGREQGRSLAERIAAWAQAAA
ncbi:MAG TPA: patatin-like phospholipase family protein [Dehalococcoidia bacterium]